MSSSASVKHLVIHVVHMTDTRAPQSRQQLRVTMQLQLSATAQRRLHCQSIYQRRRGARGRTRRHAPARLPGRLLVTSQHD